MSPETKERSPALAQGLYEEPEPYEPDPMAKRETLELVRAYYRIADPQVRKRLFDLTKALAVHDSDEDEVPPPDEQAG